MPTNDYIGKTIEQLRNDSRDEKLGLLGNLILAKAEGDKLLNLPLASGASECLNLPIRFLNGLLP